MATSFYQRQADAKKTSTLLIFLFVVAVILIVASISGATWLVSEKVLSPKTVHSLEMATGGGSSSLKLPLMTGAGALALILCGSFYKIAQLRMGGGTLVAESLGGRRISPSTNVPNERKLMNIVEEMAIASGVPVPPVFMMDEEGINAFAAGYSPADAVLGVTKGCIEQLSRHELQGVIAHEFSHILNGDMKMSIKLIGVLHGILLIGLTGQMILRNLFYFGGGSRRRSDKKDNGGGVLIILAVAVVAIIVGFIGVFFGNLIKAAVSRQREFLADASAVQFTRDPSGISGALKRIGGVASGSQLQNANASEASHLFFSQAVWAGLGGLWATHPPLDVRIRAIDPNWDGKFIKSGGKNRQKNQATAATNEASKLASNFAGQTSSARSESAAASVMSSTSGNVPAQAIHNGLDFVGEPTLQHQQYAAALIDDLPKKLLESTREAYGARAVIFCLLMDSDPTIRDKQLEIVGQESGKGIQLLVKQLQSSVDTLAIQKRLPIIDLCLASLRSLSNNQYRSFIRCFNDLAKADNRLDLFEWVMIQIITRHLKPQFDKSRPAPDGRLRLSKLRKAVETVLLAISSAGNSASQKQQAFSAGAKALPELALQIGDMKAGGLKELNNALDQLATASAHERRRLIDACAAAVEADGHITWQEAELLRGIADLLDCPIPPILPS